MFVLCPQCQFLVALDPVSGQPPARCPRCQAAMTTQAAPREARGDAGDGSHETPVPETPVPDVPPVRAGIARTRAPGLATPAPSPAAGLADGAAAAGAATSIPPGPPRPRAARPDTSRTEPAPVDTSRADVGDSHVDGPARAGMPPSTPGSAASAADETHSAAGVHDPAANTASPAPTAPAVAGSVGGDGSGKAVAADIPAAREPASSDATRPSSRARNVPATETVDESRPAPHPSPGTPEASGAPDASDDGRGDAAAGTGATPDGELAAAAAGTPSGRPLAEAGDAPAGMAAPDTSGGRGMADGSAGSDHEAAPRLPDHAPPDERPTEPPAGASAAPSAGATAVAPSFVRRATAGSGVAHAARRWPRLLAIAGLGLLLLVQLLLADRDRLAAQARWRPVLVQACALLRCRLPPWHDPAAFTLLDRDVRPHPGVRGALRVTATFRNDAPWPQALPRVLLTLSDVDGRVAGARAFSPAEYAGRARDAAGAGRTDADAAVPLLASGASARLQVDVVEPSPRIVAFTFDFQ